MNFFGNRCCKDDMDYGNNGCGCGIDPCLLLILLLCGGGHGGGGCGIDCCSILWLVILMSICGGHNCCEQDYPKHCC